MFEKNPERPGPTGSLTWVHPKLRPIVKSTTCPKCSAKPGRACMNTRNPEFFAVDDLDARTPRARRTRRTKAQIAADRANGITRKRKRAKRRTVYYAFSVHADREVQYAIAHPEEYATANDGNDHDHGPARRERQSRRHA